MTEEVEKLLAYGRMGLETGQYEQAREDFEKVLALDSSNREAMKGLARVNEILSRRVAMAIEPTQIEPVTPPQKEPKGSPMEWFQRQSRLGKIAILAGVPLVLCCLCVGLGSLMSSTPEPTPTLTPTLALTNTPVPTPSGLPTVVLGESLKKQIFRDWVDAQSTGMGDEEARAETARGWGITMDHVKAIIAEGVRKSWMPTATPIPIPPTPTPKPTRVKPTPTPTEPHWYTYENAAVAIAAVKETPGPMFLEAAPGYTYICFYVNYAHIGSTGTVFVSEFDFRLEVDNVIYEPTLAICEPGLKMVDLMPGGQTDGWVTFEAPADFTHAELLWETGLFGPTISTVTLRAR